MAESAAHPCKFVRRLNDLPEAERAEIKAALAAGSTSNVEAGRLLGIPDVTVSRHRRGVCSCASLGDTARGQYDMDRDRERKGDEFEHLVREIAAELQRQGVGLDTLGSVKSIKATEGTYQMLYKDAEDVGHVVDLEKSSVVIALNPTWDKGPEWQTVQPAAPTKIVHRKSPKRTSELRTALILPDPQIGFRRDMHSPELTLDPFHDEAALDVAIQLAHHIRPDVTVNLGDGLDFPQFSKYPQEPTFAFTVQQSLDRYHRFLADQRAAVGEEGEVVVLEGNHDRRLENAIKNNCAAAYGIKVANIPEAWPVMSLPYLLRFDELDVNYIGGYPAGIFWLNDRLACVHGFKAKQGSTAAGYDERHSLVFGHVHRRELHTRRKRDRFGSYTTVNCSPGCLSRIDGAVPSVKGSTDILGRAVPRAEDWQHGVAVVHYETAGEHRFWIDLVPIDDGVAFYDGRFFTAREEQTAAA